MWKHLNDLSEKEYEPSLDGGCILNNTFLRYRFAIMVWSRHIHITISYIQYWSYLVSNSF